MIQRERVKNLNSGKDTHGRFVLYWMQASQRVRFNHALEYAVREANERNQPLVVYFGITDDFPGANARHYFFMLEGLCEVRNLLRERGIYMVVRHESPHNGVIDLAGDASLLVADRGYLRIQKQWRSHVARRVECPMVQVESDVVVPVEVTSDKEEYAASTIRSKIHKHLETYLIAVEQRSVKKSSLPMDFESLDVSDPQSILDSLDVNHDVGPVDTFHGGESKAQVLLEDFIDNKLDHFDDLRNDPTAGNLSNMSPYLHFGQISPLDIALQVKNAGSSGEESYLEELIVRRELSMNFIYYNDRYDSLDALPDWARKTLSEHAGDKRDYTYSYEEFAQGKTHDPYWNAAQLEMVRTGKMHGYMRMYWGKKIIEWTSSPEDAYDIAIRLNDTYELDGRDPNGFTGVLWCFGKHDRAWKERPVFGKTRYMNENGLKRKFDIDKYVEIVDAL